MNHKNTFLSLSNLGYGNEILEQLDFKDLLRNFEANSIQLTDEPDYNNRKVEDVEASFNFLCQPLLVDAGGREVVEQQAGSDESEIVFL